MTDTQKDNCLDIFPFSALKASNVEGTIEVIKLACHSHVKPLYFVSTMSVIPSHVLRREDYKLNDQDATFLQAKSGYAYKLLICFN
jgi:thioester reductase-like protein